MHILSLLWRLIVLTVSLIVSTAVVAVAGLYAIAHEILLLDPAATDFAGDRVLASFDDLLVFFLTLLVAAAHAFTPWILAIAVTEIMRWRHLLVHLAAGAFVAVVAAATSGVLLLGTAVTGAAATGRGVAVIAALGILGGFVHWVIAGRRAGQWSEGLLGPDRAADDEDRRP